MGRSARRLQFLVAEGHRAVSSEVAAPAVTVRRPERIPRSPEPRCGGRRDRPRGRGASVQGDGIGRFPGARYGALPGYGRCVRSPGRREGARRRARAGGGRSPARRRVPPQVECRRVGQSSKTPLSGRVHERFGSFAAKRNPDRGSDGAGGDSAGPCCSARVAGCPFGGLATSPTNSLRRCRRPRTRHSNGPGHRGVQDRRT